MAHLSSVVLAAQSVQQGALADAAVELSFAPTDEDEDWAFIVVSRFWLLPWKLLLLPWNLEVVVLLPCSAVAASTADVIDGPRAERTDSIT